MGASTIDVCLRVVPWAEVPALKGAFKFYVILAYDGLVPVLVILTGGKVARWHVNIRMP
jgi:hypothetical protein